jgi:exodeoxyribonuclease V gamma subunit
MLAASCRVEGIDLKKHILFKHHLQPFNANYFIPAKKEQSYSEQHCACACAFQGASTDAPDFFEQPLPEDQETDLALSLDELVRFFRNPSAYLLRERLNVSLEPQVFSIAERESFQLGGLERYKAEQDLLQEFLSNPDAEGSFEHCAALGILPHGAAGRAAYLQSVHAVRRFVHDLNRFSVTQQNPESRLFELKLEDCMLSAAVSLNPDSSLVHRRHAAIKPNDFIKIWLEYLVCCAVEGNAPCAILAGLDQKNRERTQLWKFKPVEDPCAELKSIIALYREGQCRPLAFMPQVSFAYAEALSTGKNQVQAGAAAARSLARSNYTSSELDDACFGRFFDESIVEAPDFERCAREVFGSILQHREKKM